MRLCRNSGIRAFVILKPLASLRINSVKNLIISTESIIEILRLAPQNNIKTQSPKEKGIYQELFGLGFVSSFDIRLSIEEAARERTKGWTV